MKATVLYDSKTGNTAKMAEYIVAGMQSVAGVEARAFHIDKLDPEYANASKLLVVGTPTYNGYLSGKMKTWLESGPAKLKVAGKLAGSYATAAYIHGGGELAVQCVLTHLMVEGMMAYSAGGAKGNPVIHLGPVAIAPRLGEFEELFIIYGRRMAEQAVLLFGN